MESLKSTDSDERYSIVGQWITRNVLHQEIDPSKWLGDLDLGPSQLNEQLRNDWSAAFEIGDESLMESYEADIRVLQAHFPELRPKE